MSQRNCHCQYPATSPPELTSALPPLFGALLASRSKRQRIYLKQTDKLPRHLGAKLASFDLHMRVWRRLVPPTPPMDAQQKVPPTAAAAAASPAPRAFHVSWAFDNNVYVHGGEGPVGGATATFGNSEVDDILGGVGRDPFAEEDGGAPLGSGRVATANTAGSGSTAPGSSFRKNGALSTDGAKTGPKGRKGGRPLPSPVIAGVAPGRPAVSVLEDLWKLNPRTLLWERVRVARGGNTAYVVLYA